MTDWGPILVAVLLFALLSPGMLFQMPGRRGCVDFCSFQTSGVAILVHTVFYFALICLFTFAIQLHVWIG
ncbi:hypothetical protein CTI12_AA535610 [Artemisia annua]|uniref:Transmembrane protein n=1 Tax=Artemisia annua TaxID=35608 RepID=A0A2U1L2I1_ARTAN|nr:hypothetical protein CTI12_AA535610 [Artemisia annua]